MDGQMYAILNFKKWWDNTDRSIKTYTLASISTDSKCGLLSGNKSPVDNQGEDARIKETQEDQGAEFY